MWDHGLERNWVLVLLMELLPRWWKARERLRLIAWFHFQCVGLLTAPSGECFGEQYKGVAMGNSPQ